MKKGLLCIFPCLVSVRGAVQITLWRAWISQRVFHDFWWDLEQQQEEEVFFEMGNCPSRDALGSDVSDSGHGRSASYVMDKVSEKGGESRGSDGRKGEERRVRAWAGGRRVEQSSLFLILTSNYVGEFQSGVS